MKNRKPILHARDHLPGGADPLPGYGVPDVETGAPPNNPPSEMDTAAAHWWRFRDGPWDIDDLPAHSNCTEDQSNTLGVSGNGTWMCIQNNAFAWESTHGNPGPNADSIALCREWNEADFDANNWSMVASPLWDIGVAASEPASVAGWFKFKQTPGRDVSVFSFGRSTSNDVQTWVDLNQDGSLTFGRKNGPDPAAVYQTAAGTITFGTWHYLAVVIGLGRMRLYVDPGYASPAEVPEPTIGSEFPFQGPLAMETWGLEKGDYTSAELATRLTEAGFKSVAVQLNAEPMPGRDHSDYITQLAADVDVLQAAGLEVVGWGVVDANTASDLAATGVTGWLPQIEGPSQRDAVITALGAGVGAGLPKATVTTYGGLDTPEDVADLAAAGITAALVEAYADDGHSDISVMLAAGQSYGFDLTELMPIVGTYRGEGPSDYQHFDASIIPNYGIYNIPQTSQAALTEFAAVNGGAASSAVVWVNPTIDEPDPATTVHAGSGGSAGLAIGVPFLDLVPDVDGAMEGCVTEVFACNWMLPGDQVREGYLSGGYGDTGTPPITEAIPPGGVKPSQIQPPATDGQFLGSVGGVATWVDAPAAGLAYLGDWDEDTDYVDGDIVVYDDRLWLCVQPTTGPPPSDGWAV